MGSSDTATGVVDCSIGSIVWVRRRNGSWWPGKILGPDELSASHVMSPRSGTPVKLLGREDASVDWYNLEKSKRVKAFRCGEFDDCIERAEASQGMPPKKREKYARREDAILHALELERQTLEKKYGKVGCSTNGVLNKSPNGVKGEQKMSSENLEIGNGRHLQSETHIVSKNLYLSLKDKGEDQDMFSQRVKEENEFCLDGDNSGVTPRMRGLRDFGLRVPSSLKTSPSASPNGSHKPLFGSNAQTHPNDSLGPEDMVDTGIENSSDKRKRPHEGLGDDSLAKRRERRLPLLQVLENSSKALVPHSEANDGVNLTSFSEDEQPGRSRYASMQHADLDEDNIGSTEDTETDSSETDSLDSDTDELASLSEGAASIELQPKYPRRSEAREEQSVSSEELDELALADEASHPCYNGPASSTSMGVSRWQLKGKRNTRSLMKRPVDGADRNFSWGTIDETTAFETGTNGRDETHAIEKNYKSQMARYGSRGLDGISRRTMQWQQWDYNEQPAIRGYWDDSGKYFDPVLVGRQQFGGRTLLVDVDLKVQSSSYPREQSSGHPREHVPMISLMSKLNGQAIVGHPIQIEALENGSTESLLAETDDWCPDVLENETALAPTWRTARRTANFRVPRPDLSSACDESAKNLQFVDVRRGGSSSSGKLEAGSIGNKGGIMEKHLVQVAVDRKSSRKPQKKISLSSNQKTRTLSSIASQPKRSSDVRREHGGNNYGMDGLKPTAVACIPVKLVFSRLQEELVGRHP